MKSVPRRIRASILALAIVFDLAPIEGFAQTAPVTTPGAGARPLAATPGQNRQLRRARGQAGGRLVRAQRAARAVRRQIRRETRPRQLF